MPELSPDIEFSAVMPCLNEEETVGICVKKALDSFQRLGVRGEVVVADNGSTDRSVEIARSLGARVIHEPVKGYGAALKAAIGAARGRYCIMGDADDSYDWSFLEPFVVKLREGYELVMGTRLKGEIRPGAMPVLHRFLGNPFFSAAVQLCFGSGISDAYCGMRGFTAEAFDKLKVRSVGMEFAVEMVVKAANKGLKTTEVPITLHRDGRSRRPHLRSFRDGWRTLRLLLMFAPDYLYVIPGAFLLGGGLLLQLLLINGPVIVRGYYLGVHWLALGCLCSLLGFQVISLGAFAKAFGMNESFEMRGPIFKKVLSWFSLEIGIIIGLILAWLGLLADIALLFTWLARNFGPMQSTHIVFVATTVMALGVQIVFSSFFLGMFKLGVDDQARSGMDSQ